MSVLLILFQLLEQIYRVLETFCEYTLEKIWKQLPFPSSWAVDVALQIYIQTGQ